MLWLCAQGLPLAELMGPIVVSGVYQDLTVICKANALIPVLFLFALYFVKSLDFQHILSTQICAGLQGVKRLKTSGKSQPQTRPFCPSLNPAEPTYMVSFSV